MEESVRDRFLRMHRSHVAQYSIVSLDPPIFYVQLQGDGLDQFVSRYQMLFSALRGRPAYCLCFCSFNLSRWAFREIARLEASCKEQFPDIRLVHLCNEPGQDELFRARGAEAVFCNQNCFIDESIFRPLPGAEQRFDAVYDARFAEVKRHQLAREVSSLALIYYPRPSDDPRYVDAVGRQLAHAHRFNRSASGGFQFLSPRQVNECLNACRVGLCLSAEEGAMYASAQYLLSGLPIVTTPSQGGRDVFFEASFVRTVPPEPGEVRRAVEDLVGQALDPEPIRNATLQKVRIHRATFIALVQSIYDRHGVQRSFLAEWPRVFFHTMIHNRNHQETITLLRNAGAIDLP